MKGLFHKMLQCSKADLFEREVFSRCMRDSRRLSIIMLYHAFERNRDKRRQSFIANLTTKRPCDGYDRAM